MTIAQEQEVIRSSRQVFWVHTLTEQYLYGGITRNWMDYHKFNRYGNRIHQIDPSGKWGTSVCGRDSKIKTFRLMVQKTMLRLKWETHSCEMRNHFFGCNRASLSVNIVTSLMLLQSGSQVLLSMQLTRSGTNNFYWICYYFTKIKILQGEKLVTINWVWLSCYSRISVQV